MFRELLQHPPRLLAEHPPPDDTTIPPAQDTEVDCRTHPTPPTQTQADDPLDRPPPIPHSAGCEVTYYALNNACHSFHVTYKDTRPSQFRPALRVCHR